jgi:hypothetical protein
VGTDVAVAGDAGVGIDGAGAQAAKPNMRALAISVRLERLSMSAILLW